MPRRPAKSREAGLFKACRHLWDGCECPWLGRYRTERYVNLAQWAGLPPLNKTRAKVVLAEVKVAINGGTFRKEGKTFDPKTLATTLSFAEFVQRYRTYLTEDRGIKEDPDSSLHGVLNRWERTFGEKLLGEMVATEVWEEFLKPMGNANRNRQRSHAQAMFKWAMQPKINLVLRNPINEIDKRQEKKQRKPPRLDDGGVKEQDLLLALTKAYPHVGDGKHNLMDALNAKRRKAMERRIVGALDTGLRKKELAFIQVKHINYKTWEITLPTSKGESKTGEQESVFAMTPRLQKILEERRWLGPEGYVFGTESGKFQKGWRRAWINVFGKAGLKVGRGKFVWHSLRNEFISSIADDPNASTHELQALARHRNIQTTMRYMKAKEERLKELLRRKGNV